MDVELALTAILGLVAALLVAAQFTRVPYPILLVLGGLGLGFAPAFPDVELDPEVVLVVLLPPLLYSAAFFTPLRELRRNVRPISLLAIGLVLATMLAVAAVAHGALGFGWAEAFVLGAIVSPTDPVAATAIARRLNVPARIVTIVEGESLINDGTALVAYKFAIAPSSPAASACSTPGAASCSMWLGGSASGWWPVPGSPSSAGASTLPPSRSRSPCSAATSPTCRRRRSASRGCSPR